MQKVLLVLTSHAELGNTGKATGFWLSELTHPYYALKDAGLSVDIVSIKGGKAPIDPGSANEKDPANDRFTQEGGLSLLENTPTLASINSKDYAAIVFAGGHGTMWDFPNDPAVLKKAPEIYENGGVVAAICHGPAALVNLKLSDGKFLIAGKKVTGFTNEEEEIVGLTNVVPFLLADGLKKAEGNYQEKPAWQEHVVVDERLVTGQNPQSATGVGNAVVSLLKN